MHLTLTTSGIPSLCITAWCMAAWLLSTSLLHAQTIHPYRTPQAIGLTSQLLARSPSSNTQLDLPLLDWVENTTLRDQIPLWIDRRIPSDSVIAVEVPKDQNNRDVLNLVASKLDAEIAYIDRYVALVPKGTAQAIEWSYWTLHIEATRPNAQATRKEPFEWNDGSDSREIWKSFVAQYDLPSLESQGDLAKRVDRWRAMRLESTNLAAIATLLLSGFDQRLSWTDPSEPRIAPLLADYQAFADTSAGGGVRFQYANEIPKIGKTNWQAWKSRWPQAVAERASQNNPASTDAWVIVAPVAAHRELVESLAPIAKPKPNTTLANKKYTGRYRGEILKILASLSQQLSLQVDSNDLATNLARQEVDVSFKDATLEELLAKLSEASGLTIKLEGQSIVVRRPGR